MKKYNASYIAALALLLGTTAVSCSDELFPDGGDGILKMKMIVNSDVTRAEVDDTSLADNCVIYISSQKGLIHKFKGVQNVPSDLWLKSGNYVAEAWTGDSVSASFDKKFYKAYEPFTIHEGVNNVVLNCKIANVVASVDRSRISDEMLPEFTVTIGNTRGQLVFNAENVNEARGFYMMPDGENTLSYTIEGKNILGTKFTKTGEIPGVERAHEYILHLNYNDKADPNDVGGAFITITVDDTELLIEDNIEIKGGPRLEMLGGDISSPIAGQMGSFDDLYLVGACFGSFSHVNLQFSDRDAFGVGYDKYDLIAMAETTGEALRATGLTWSISNDVEGQSQLRLKMPAAMLNALPNGSYELTVTLQDDALHSISRVIRIEVSDAKVIAQPVASADIRSHNAYVNISVVDETMANAGLRFRVKGTQTWTTAEAETRAANLRFHLTGLQPATTYEVQATADGYVNTQIIEFTTEGTFAVPNCSFEDWSTYLSGSKNIPFPGTGASTTFWSSGNEGSMTMNKAVTSQSTSMKHSGNSSVKLESQFVGVGSIGKFAAGNLFAGDYLETIGTDGHLRWGRPIPYCHPVKLSGYANYRPGVVSHSSTDLLKKGETDKGTIYAAVVSRQVDVNTKTKELFDPAADYVLAYGQIIWDTPFGPDGDFQQFEIPLQWKNTEYSGQMYIIIVASASLYGDYFTGGPSVMYLDDLQLWYE